MAIAFNGTSQYLRSNQAPVPGVPLTLACWFRTTSATGTQALVTIQSEATSHRISLTAFGGGAGQPIIATLFDGTNSTASSASGFSANTWTHAAAVFPSTASRTAYIHGLAGAAETTPRSPSGLATTSIGARYSSGFGLFLAGSIAEVGVWSVALSAEEIASLAKGVACDHVRPQSLVFYAPLIREVVDLARGAVMSNVGGAVAAEHPRVYA